MKSKRRLLLIVLALALTLVGLIAWLSSRHKQLYKVTILPSLGGGITQPAAINDTGQITGSVGTYQSPGQLVPCFWDSTDPAAGLTNPLLPPIDYPAMGRRGTSDLNNNGFVLGRMYHWDKGEQWAFLWSKGTGIERMKYLFPLENRIGSLRINDANQVLHAETRTSSLGRISKKYFPPYTQRCLWDPKRGNIVLDKQVPLRMGKLLHVRDINNQGCIVGIIRSAGLGQESGVLLEPIPKRWGK